MPASRRLSSVTCSTSRLSSSSSCCCWRSAAVAAGLLPCGDLVRARLGITLSPGLYSFASSSFCSSVLPLSGLAAMNSSSRALSRKSSLVSRTGALQAGQRKTGVVRVSAAACARVENQYFRHDPQKLWRQSRSASG